MKPEVSGACEEACKTEYELLANGLSPLVRFNFCYAGAVIDVNKLVSHGWKLLTGVHEGSEIHLAGCSWLEYVVVRADVEYHITLSVGNAMSSGVDEEGAALWRPVVGDLLLQTYRGESPRRSFVRRLSCWTFVEAMAVFRRDDDAVTDDMLTCVYDHFEAAIQVRPKMLVDDIEAQADAISLSGDEDECSDAVTDQDFVVFKLLAILKLLKEEDNKDAMARLLVPIARAVLTDVDPTGRRYLKKLTSAMCVWGLLEHAQFAKMPEATLAVAKLLSEMPNRSLWGRLGFYDFAGIVESALRYGMFWNAVRAVKSASYNWRRHDDRQGHALRRMLRALQEVLCSGASCPAEAWSVAPLRLVVDELELMCSGSQDQLLLSVARVRLDEIEGVDAKNSCERVWCVQRECEQLFDAAHAEQLSAVLPWMAKNVKTPLAWQSALCCENGRASLVLDAFPRPLFSTERFYRLQPAEEPVVGLSRVDIWQWLLPHRCIGPNGCDLVEIMKCMNRWTHDAVIANVKENSWQEWNGEPRLPKALSLWRTAKPEEEELSFVLVQMEYGKDENDGNKISRIPATFPFFPKEFRGGQPTVCVKLWKYHPWMYGCAADVDFSLEDGRRFCAIMPYYAFDKKTIPCGARCLARFVGFAIALDHHAPFVPRPSPQSSTPVEREIFEMIECRPKCEHLFRQGIWNEFMEGSLFEMRGLVKEVRRLKALGEEVICITISCTELKSETLNDELEVFIGADNVGPGLVAGNEISVQGWLYLDVYKVLEPVTGEALSESSKMAFAPQRQDVGGVKAPDFVRLEPAREHEKSVKVFGGREADWLALGKSALYACRGVEYVSEQGWSPQRIRYLVKKNGALQRYGLTVLGPGEERIVDECEPAQIVIRTEKADLGLKLAWEGLPK